MGPQLHKSEIQSGDIFFKTIERSWYFMHISNFTIFLKCLCLQTLLFGAKDSSTLDDKMQITVAFNHFGKRLVQRMPRCRFGYFHVVNNDYTHWLMYAIGGSSHPTIISQGNRYKADHPFAKQVCIHTVEIDVNS